MKISDTLQTKRNLLGSLGMKSPSIISYIIQYFQKYVVKNSLKKLKCSIEHIHLMQKDSSKRGMRHKKDETKNQVKWQLYFPLYQ